MTGAVPGASLGPAQDAVREDVSLVLSETARGSGPRALGPASGAPRITWALQTRSGREPLHHLQYKELAQRTASRLGCAHKPRFQRDAKLLLKNNLQVVFQLSF